MDKVQDIPESLAHSQEKIEMIFSKFYFFLNPKNQMIETLRHNYQTSFYSFGAKIIL